MQRRNVIIATLLIVASIWSWQVSEQPAEVAPESAQQAPDHTVDYYVRDFSVTTMSPEGQPARQLQADLMQHFLDDDTTRLTNPYLQVHNPDSASWEVRAERGWISGDGELLLLSGAVEIHRPGSPAAREIHLATRDLRVQPEQDYAETDEAVTITSEQNWVKSTGMQAWLREPVRLKLLSDTRAHYVH